MGGTRQGGYEGGTCGGKGWVDVQRERVCGAGGGMARDCEGQRLARLRGPVEEEARDRGEPSEKQVKEQRTHACARAESARNVR